MLTGQAVTTLLGVCRDSGGEGEVLDRQLQGEPGREAWRAVPSSLDQTMDGRGRVGRRVDVSYMYYDKVLSAASQSGKPWEEQQRDGEAMWEADGGPRTISRGVMIMVIS